ncbi:DUF3140 domain-containing protein [Streptomyces sp. NPDC048389]|uniref:DUF3140 domain-containing protein n=1 Tax=Streptomyces sp. NPDC048389 TaxID=3154622 RepID=UPI0034553FF6
MTDALELDALWEEFRGVVNMTSQELSARLQAQDAGEDTDPPPDGPGSPTRRKVLAVPRKRRTDLTDDDVRVMYQVVDTVQARREQSAAGTDDTRGRHRLMALGHDPLKAGRPNGWPVRGRGRNPDC